MQVIAPCRLFCCWTSSDDEGCGLPARYLVRTKVNSVRHYACSACHAEALRQDGDTVEPLPGAGE